MDRSEERFPKKGLADREKPLTTRESSACKKERETKDDGRYIIFYTFEDDEENRGKGDGG